MMIRIDENLVLKAKEYGLNINRVSENALKEMIKLLEVQIIRKSSKTAQTILKIMQVVARGT